MEYKTFAEFYPYYLEQHSNINTKRLHVIGTALALLALLKFLFTFSILALIFVPIFGYGFAWIAHTFIEKNKPATFEHPWYSFLGDLNMCWDVVRGRIKLW